MSVQINDLEALRRKADVQGKSDALNAFRGDFQLVWRTWIDRRDESAGAYAEAASNVKQHMSDPDWMASASAHFAQMAGAIRRDQERSAQIKDEMRAAWMERRAAA